MENRTRASVVRFLAGLLCWTPVAAQDLAEVYSVPLEFVKDVEERPLYTWTAGPEDVFEIRGFDLNDGDDLRIRVSSGDLVIGHSEQSALWAVLVPDKPAKISSDKGGDGESATVLFFRFHPSRVGELFPKKIIRGAGDPDALFWAYRTYGGKIDVGWNVLNLPVVPPEKTILVDADTKERRRRVYEIDTDRGRVKHKGGFVAQALPELAKVSRRDAQVALESAWSTMDERYALFAQSGGVDWEVALDDARKQASRSKSAFDVGIAIRRMLDRLDDEDLWIYVGDELVTCDQFSREFNASWTGIRHVLGDVNHEEHGISWGRTPHNVGYLNLRWFGNDEVIEELDEALETIGDTWAMILDLRFTRYGEEELARKIAGRFLADPTVYGFVQERNGEAHDAFADAEELECEPRGPWTYDAPLYLLLGPGTARRGEQLALMLRSAPKVVTCGSPTLGLNTNNTRIELDGGYSIVFATGRDLDADGNVIMGTGIVPDVAIDLPDGVADDQDPVLYRALEEVLDTPVHDRKAGNRNAPKDADEDE